MGGIGMNNQRLELVADFYEYTMANGYFNKNMEDKIAYFDVFLGKYQMKVDMQ